MMLVMAARKHPGMFALAITVGCGAFYVMWGALASIERTAMAGHQLRIEACQMHVDAVNRYCERWSAASSEGAAKCIEFRNGGEYQGCQHFILR